MSALFIDQFTSYHDITDIVVQPEKLAQGGQRSFELSWGALATSVQEYTVTERWS